ncbi:hypothetical protein GOEFS_051_00090 [Gordonia effusa NBRC 100432]|uniref:G domain-containing protein n=1 Tax=Gordonia effusa NBRC 100432 TaxID=1077974 RepID=H0QZR3_9ACTN|nr:GTPase [Gordonia effusa]GAB18314.1 hypothetical protein GOEFS_051_00090 [Gordonia effusa NBRC 100432]
MTTLATVTSVVMDILDDLKASCPADRDALTQLQSDQSAAPSVLFAGRGNAGKSTLVNALLGTPLAETAELESTQVLTEYRDGAPARADVIDSDGQVYQVVAGPTQSHIALPVAASAVQVVRRWLPSVALRELRLIDTPGLSTLTDQLDAAARAALGVTETASTTSHAFDADVAVFLFDSELRADEHEVLAAWQFTPLTTVGVLSRADAYGAGAFGVSDPITAAQDRAAAMAEDLRDYVGTVLAVSGICAQVSATGTLTQADARLLAALADEDRWSLADAAMGGDSVVAQLMRRFGEYTVVCGREHAGAGAASLTGWLGAVSGLAALRQTVLDSATRYGPLRRTARVLDELERLALHSPHHAQIRARAHQLRVHSALRSVHMFSDYQRLLRTAPQSPFVDELRGLLAHDSPPLQLGLPTSASAREIADCVHRRLDAVHRAALLMSTSTAVESARLTLSDVYQQVLEGVS